MAPRPHEARPPAADQAGCAGQSSAPSPSGSGKPAPEHAAAPTTLACAATPARAKPPPPINSRPARRFASAWRSAAETRATPPSRSWTGVTARERREQPDPVTADAESYSSLGPHSMAYIQQIPSITASRTQLGWKAGLRLGERTESRWCGRHLEGRQTRRQKTLTGCVPGLQTLQRNHSFRNTGAFSFDTIFFFFFFVSFLHWVFLSLCFLS